MPTDQSQAQISVGSVAKEIVPPGAVSSQPVEGIAPTHQDFKPPPGLEIIQPVPTPDLSGVAGTGAVQHPPKAATVKGDAITYPPGIVDLKAARQLREGVDSLAGLARVVVRQEEVREERAA